MSGLYNSDGKINPIAFMMAMPKMLGENLHKVRHPGARAEIEAAVALGKDDKFVEWGRKLDKTLTDTATSLDISQVEREEVETVIRKESVAVMVEEPDVMVSEILPNDILRMEVCVDEKEMKNTSETEAGKDTTVARFEDYMTNVNIGTAALNPVSAIETMIGKGKVARGDLLVSEATLHDGLFRYTVGYGTKVMIGEATTKKSAKTAAYYLLYDYLANGGKTTLPSVSEYVVYDKAMTKLRVGGQEFSTTTLLRHLRESGYLPTEKIEEKCVYDAKAEKYKYKYSVTVDKTKFWSGLSADMMEARDAAYCLYFLRRRLKLKKVKCDKCGYLVNPQDHDKRCRVQHVRSENYKFDKLAGDHLYNQMCIAFLRRKGIDPDKLSQVLSFVRSAIVQKKMYIALGLPELGIASDHTYADWLEFAFVRNSDVRKSVIGYLEVFKELWL